RERPQAGHEDLHRAMIRACARRELAGHAAGQLGAMTRDQAELGAVHDRRGPARASRATRSMSALSERSVAGYRALVVSVLAHAALLAAIARWLDGKEPGAWDRAARGAGERDAIAIELVPAAPAQDLEVALVPDEALDVGANAAH